MIPAAIIGPIVCKAGFESWGATPGKMAVGNKVVDINLNPPGILRAVKRVILPVLYTFAFVVVLDAAAVDTENTEFVSWFKAVIAVSAGLMILYVIDSLWMTGNEDRQTLRDKVAGTYVVRSRGLT